MKRNLVAVAATGSLLAAAAAITTPTALGEAHAAVGHRTVSTPPRPTVPTDLSSVEAERPVVDTILPARRLRNTTAPARSEEYIDAHGHRFVISTDIPDVDLQPYANVLASTIHGSELSTLRVWAVRLADMAQACGSAEAVACYGADDPDTSAWGTMIFAVDDSDVVHSIVHEYGHHHDNQLLNLRHLGMGCGWDNDGSRNWFFEREMEDEILDAGVDCGDNDWEYLLGEVFAEDFVALNGITKWTLQSVRSPTSGQLNAMRFDIANPFEPGYFKRRRFVRTKRSRTISFRIRHWTSTRVQVRGPWRSDLDLYLYRGNATRPWAKSTRRGSYERIRTLLPPGRYEIDVHAYKRAGVGRVRVDLD